MRVQLSGELAAGARLDAPLAHLADDVSVEAANLARRASEGGAVDLALAREGRVARRRLHRHAVGRVARVPAEAAREQHEAGLWEVGGGL